MPSKKFEDDEKIILAPPKNRILIKRKRKRQQTKMTKSILEDEVTKVTKLCEIFDPSNVPSSVNSFDYFPISSATLNGLHDSSYTIPTKIQCHSLGHSILGKDVVGAAKTGSGKTLALLIPILECLWRNRWTKFDGLGALIITPTRELAFQIFQVLNKIGAHHEFSAALLIGGTDVEFEKNRLYTINIIICTPGRLLQHMDENEHFNCDNMQILAIDEADRILDMGFRQQIDAVIENLPKQRQTLLFSATQTKRVEDLIRVSLNDPVMVFADEKSSNATPDQLMQSYFRCEEEEKINMLWSFLKNNRNKKTLIFVTCCKQARFLTESIMHLRPGLYFTGLWGDMKQNKRMENFQRFDANTKGAAMICTDLASRGLDFNGLDWVLQMDCPATVDDYIHRVGRTARMDNKGEAMLMLTARQEEPFVEMLRERNVPINKVEVDVQKVLDIRMKLANLMVPFPQLKLFAQSSFVAYARAIYFMREKKVFDVTSINFPEFAKSYGLPFTPRIRFLKKQGIDVRAGEDKKSESKNTVEEVNLCKDEDEADNFHMDNYGGDEEEDGGFLQLTRKDVFNSIEGVDIKEDIMARMSTTKPITKVKVAKKMIKRLGNTGPGKRKTFDDEN